MNFFTKSPYWLHFQRSHAARLLIFLILLLNVLAAISLGISSYRTPLGNWDMIPYVALLRSSAEKEPAALSQQTYAEVHAYVGDQKYQRMVSGEGENGHYRSTLFETPSALVDNLRFYSIKPLYIFLCRQAAVLTGNAAAATVMVSGIALCLFMAIFPLFFQWQIVAAGLIWTLLFTGEPEYWMLATAASPDSLGMLLAVSTVLLAAVHRCSLWIVAPLAILAVLARPDTTFILVSLFCGLAWLERKEGRMFGLLFCMLGVVTLFLFLNAHALPWTTLFRHTFFVRQVFPSLSLESVSVEEYIGVLKRTLPHVASWRTTLFLSLGCLLALVPWLRGRIIAPPQLLSAVAVINMLAHYLIFPIDEYGHERMFLSSYVLVISAALLMLEAVWAQKPPKTQSYNS